MSVDIPNPWSVILGGSLGSIGPLTLAGGEPLRFGIESIPKILLGADKLLFGLDKVQLGLDKVQLGVDKVQLGVDKLSFGIDPVQLNLGPVQLNLSLKELPSVRVHLPVNLGVALRLLGKELFSLRLCGEAQVITEPYVANPAERCQAPQPGSVGGVPPNQE